MKHPEQADHLSHGPMQVDLLPGELPAANCQTLLCALFSVSRPSDMGEQEGAMQLLVFIFIFRLSG